jgi:hypothetical protein
MFEDAVFMMGDEADFDMPIEGESADGDPIDLYNQWINGEPIEGYVPPPSIYYGFMEPGVAGGISWPDGNRAFYIREEDVQRDGSGNLTGWTWPFDNPLNEISVSIVNPTSPSHQDASSYSTTGIEFGTWEADRTRVSSPRSHRDCRLYVGRQHSPHKSGWRGWHPYQCNPNG